MTDELNIENKFFANKGVIGRRDFFLNIVILGIITLALSMPMCIHLMYNIFSAQNLFNSNEVALKAPLWITTLYMLSVAFEIVIEISNIKRRITDICGKENNTLKYIFSAIVIGNAISIYFNFLICETLQLIYIGVLLFLIFKKGAITSKLPYDATKQFNFGAFFGGWIWGLINKVYYPLWHLVLFLTPFSFNFALICGLKGNEWALKAKDYESIEKFNSKQETQGIIFAILTMFVVPFLVYLSIFAVIFFLIISTPTEKLSTTVDKIQTYAMESTFEKCTFSENKNICYVKNDIWKNSDYREKTKILEFVAQTAESKKNSALSKDDYRNRTSKINELKITKIYSEDGKQLVAEFDIDESVFKNNNFAEIVKATAKAYKFYPISK